MRPSIYSAELAEEICLAIATTPKGIKKLCSEMPHWPAPDTLFRWIHQNKEFSDQYARAKVLQVESIIDEIMDIADDSSNDLIIGDNGKKSPNHGHINRSRLQVDTRKWLASKLAPKLYGDKIVSDEPIKFPLTIDGEIDTDSVIQTGKEIIRSIKNGSITAKQAMDAFGVLKNYRENVVVEELINDLKDLKKKINEVQKDNVMRPPVVTLIDDEREFP